MKLYRVQFKDGTRRIYGADMAFHPGDVVVVDSNHGQLVAEVLEEMERLPEGMAEEKLRYILCRVPMEDVAKRKAERELLEAEKEKREAEERTARSRQRQSELLEDMRAIMKSDSRKEAVMLRLFAEYDQEFGMLFKEYNLLKNKKEEAVSGETMICVISGPAA